MPNNISPELMALLAQYQPSDWGGSGGSPGFVPSNSQLGNQNYRGGAFLENPVFDPATNRFYMPRYEYNREEGNTTRGQLLGWMGTDNSPDHTGKNNDLYDAQGNYQGGFETEARSDPGYWATLALILGMAGGAGMTAAGAGGGGTGAAVGGAGAGEAAAVGAGGAAAGGGSTAAGLTGYDLAMADLAASSGAGFGEAAAAGSGGGLLSGAGGSTSGLTGYDAAMADLASSSGAGFGEAAAGTGATAAGAGGGGSTAATTATTATGGTSAATGTGAGTGLTMTEATNLARVAGPLIGAAMGAEGNRNSSTTRNPMDPRMDRYVYGEDGRSGLLGRITDRYNANPSGINQQMLDGWNRQWGLLTDPSVAQGYQGMRNTGNALMQSPIAGNPFTQPGGYDRSMFGGGSTPQPPQGRAMQNPYGQQQGYGQQQPQRQPAGQFGQAPRYNPSDPTGADISGLYASIGRTGQNAPSNQELDYWRGKGLLGDQLRSQFLNEAANYGGPGYESSVNAARGLLAPRQPVFGMPRY